MHINLAAAATATLFLLTACGSETDEVDTSYEAKLPSPIAETTGDEPAPTNTSISGGPDEQVDDQYAGSGMDEGTEEKDSTE